MKKRTLFLLYILSQPLLCFTYNWKAIFVDTSDFYCYLLFYNPDTPDQWCIRSLYMKDDNATLEGLIYSNPTRIGIYKKNGTITHKKMQHKYSTAYIKKYTYTKLEKIYILDDKDKDANLNIAKNQFDLVNFNASYPEHDLY